MILNVYGFENLKTDIVAPCFLMRINYKHDAYLYLSILHRWTN